MRFYQNLLLFLIVFVGVALPSFVTPALAYYGNNQYYGYTQNSGYRQRQRMMDTYSSLPNDLEASTEKIPSLEVKSCIKINSIQVDGVTKISDSTIESVTKPWKGKCVTLTDINTILDGLNKVYITRRFVNSRAYLPKQDASNGHLTILMMENTVDAFYFSGRSHALHEIFAFPWVRGSVLNLNDLEQGLDQMNRLPNWNATMKFLPGSQDTNTTVNVHVPPVNKIQGKVLVDNLSQSGVGRTMGRASVGASDILGILDQWSFEYDHSLNNRQSEGNNSYFDSELSIPLGAWLLSAGWWRSDEMLYTQPFINTQPPSTTKKRSDSTQKDFHVGVSRVIARHKVDITTLSVSYELKSFQNYTNHQRIPSQSARLASLNVTLGEFMKIWGKTWYIDIGAKIGLGGAGTKTWSDEQGKFGAHTQYIKPYLNVDGYKPITKLLMWHTVIHGEYSSRNQYGNEWLSIGGPFTVRGFLKSTAIGNAGIFMRNDLSLQMPTKNLSCGRYDIFCNGLLKGTEFCGIIDTGMTRAIYTYENMPKLVKSADIAGAGIGFRKTDGFIQWDTSATHAITTSGMPPEGWIISFQVGLKM